MGQRRIGILIMVCALVCVATIHVGSNPTWGKEEAIAPPAPDETLIYVIREGRFAGSAAGVWVAVNDQTLARVKSDTHAVVRVKAGVLTLNLALGGNVLAAAALDDRPGGTVYLKWRIGDTQFTELAAAEGKKFLRKTKPMEALDAPLPNNERVAALMNLSWLGVKLMRPSTRKSTPDSENAVITIFRRREAEKVEFGIWSDRGLVGMLRSEEAIEFKVPAGEHYFLAGNVGKTLLRANVEAGKRYHVWLDYGEMIGRLRLTPIAREQSGDLEKWLSGVAWVEVDPAAITHGMHQREETVTDFIRSRAGAPDAAQLGSEHAY